MKIAVHGLGYVGLTAAVHFAGSRLAGVVGYDPDPTVVDAINNGAPKAGEFLSYLAEVHYRDRLWATTDRTATLDLDADAHILAVPSERRDAPWMDAVVETVRWICDNARKPTCIIVESTVTPGTLRPLAEAAAACGHTFAHAPRRDWFASPDKNLSNLPRVVGALDEVSLAKAIEVLTCVTPRDRIMTTDLETAELVKPLENAIFHSVIMLVHDVALSYPNVDVATAVQLAATHWRFESFGSLYFGLGSGGRCVPLGSKYLAEGTYRHIDTPRGRTSICDPQTMFDVANLAEEGISTEIAKLIWHKTRRRVWTSNPSPAVAVLGLGYRPNFRDVGMSPGLRLAKALSLCHPFDASIVVHDPLFSPAELDEMVKRIDHQGLRAAGSTEEVRSADVVVLATAHDAYASWPQERWRGGHQTIIDAHGSWEGHDWAAKGVDYVRIGRPGWFNP